MIKAVFFDIDGTLMSHSQKAISVDTRTALDKLSKNGIKRIVATGRHMLELCRLPVNGIDFDAYITLNGQLCFDAQGNIVWENPIAGEDKARIIRLFNEKSVPIMLIERESMYINFVNRHVEFAQREISTPVPKVGAYTGNEIYQAIAYLGRENEKEVSAHLPGCKVTRWNDYAVDIVSASGGKTSGIKEYLKINIRLNSSVF